MNDTPNHPDTTADEPNYAHHGAPILTQRDFNICLAMSKWIATVRAESAKGRAPGYWPDWVPSEADIAKSRLFWRIRSGKEPLPEPPPRAYSCPWYEVVEEIDRAHWCYDDVHVGDQWVSIAQCPYDVVEWESAGTPRIVRFNCWRFRLWRGSQDAPTFSGGVPGIRTLQGWWLQREAADA